MSGLVAILLAIAAGFAIALQASINAMMGGLVKSPLLSLFVAFTLSAIFAAIALVSASPDWLAIRHASLPLYMWIIAGFCSSFGVGTMYFLIPKLGISLLMTLALSGQIVGTLLIGHFALFGNAPSPLNLQKLLGLTLLIAGVWLINSKTGIYK